MLAGGTCAVVMIVMAGCSSGGGAATNADETTSSSSTAAPADLQPTPETGPDLPPGADDLVGRWAHFDAVAYEDDVFRSYIISTGFSDIELRDGVLWNTQRFCHADMENDQGIETSISDEATSAIIPVDTPLEVSAEDGRLRVERPATPTPIGIALEDPATDVLPTDPDDPRIIDSDGDGFPGVTAHIKISEDLEGDLYLARREIFAYDVTEQTPDRFEGSITDRSEQLIIGATDDIFLTPAQWVQHPDPARNPVIWQRVDESWDCQQLALERNDLFPPNPPIDW